MKKKSQKNNIGIDDTLPHQIEAPSFKGTGMKLQPPFVNEYGVIIGDSYYTSKQSPLENWSDDVDPEIMAGDQWVHPTNDIGWNTAENKELLEGLKEQRSYPFMHPTHDTSKGTD